MIIYLKRLKSSKFVRVKAFPMYGGIGVSAPSLHRESTDSLISKQNAWAGVWLTMHISATHDNMFNESTKVSAESVNGVYGIRYIRGSGLATRARYLPRIGTVRYRYIPVLNMLYTYYIP